MPLYRDQAIVLRTQKLGEADRIVTLFTRSLGKVRVVGKGVRRTKSRFGARLEPGMMVDVQCYEGRNLDTVTQAETLAPYGDAIARDYTAYTAASAMLETCDRLTEEREPALQQYLLLAGALRSLAERSHDPALVLDAYLLRALAIAGWAPSFHDCARCGAEGPHRAFNLASGGSVCPMCRPPGSAAPAPETLELLAALLAGDWVVADGSDPRHRREGSGLTSAYLQWHLERGIRSLRLVDRETRVDTRRSDSPAVELGGHADRPSTTPVAPAQTGHRA
ncbi:MAG: DNA repair protein RecO [Micrococcales bacterium]|nr:DNA repair protein RecO [Micrococcales bacterium]